MAVNPRDFDELRDAGRPANDEIIQAFITEFDDMRDGPDLALERLMSNALSPRQERQARIQELRSRAYNEAGYRLDHRFDYEDNGMKKQWDSEDWQRAMNISRPAVTEGEQVYYERVYQEAFLGISTKLGRPIDLSRMPEDDPE